MHLSCLDKPLNCPIKPPKTSRPKVTCYIKKNNFFST